MINRIWIVAGAVLALTNLLPSCGGGPPPVSFTVNNAADTDDGTCDAANCTLREAINAANTTPGFNGIYFNIPGTGVHIIQTSAGLPAVTEQAVIDASTQPGYAGMPLIELRSAVAQSGTGLSVRGGNSTVNGFSIVNFNVGVELRDQGGDWVVNNFIGLDPDGTTVEGNATGVLVKTASNRIGAPQSYYRNWIAANGVGVDIDCTADQNLVQNNFVGINAAGNAAGNTGTGILVCGSHNTIGGTDPLMKNVVSGNQGVGIQVKAASPYPATDNTIAHNMIGVDGNGFMAIGNGSTGVAIASDANTISDNTISGNGGDGILVNGRQSNTITGNNIGVNSSSTQALPNGGNGISLSNASNNWIGGTGSGDGNVISGNGKTGISITASPGAAATANGVQGNKIGVNAAGTTAIPNQQDGILVTGNGNTIGGTNYAARNMISGNLGNGVWIKGNQNVVELNSIGTDDQSTAALGNGGDGVRLTDGAHNNSIGLLGGFNMIAYNQGAGIRASTGAGTGNLLEYNGIHDNGGLGIQLGNSSIPLPNDQGDPDTGPNNLQNYPHLISAVSMFNSQFKASFTGAPGGTFTIDYYKNAYCDPSGYGEGHQWMHSFTFTTDINGNALIVSNWPSTYFADGVFITATVTDSASNTSEFSNCIAVVQATPTPSLTNTLSLSTLPIKVKPFFTVKLSAPQIYYRGTGCGDQAEKFQVQVEDPGKVAGVWLFVRLVNKDGEGFTDWGEALVMTPLGSGWYEYNLPAVQIPSFTKYANAYLQYQFVAYDKGFNKVATSDVMGDVILSVCHS